MGVKIPVTKTLNRSIESAAFTLPDLHHDELAFSDSLSNNHRIRFLGGRIALRRAMGPNLSQRVAPVLRGPRGAPTLALCGGSISHKDEVAAAIVRFDLKSHVDISEPNMVQETSRKIRECIGIDVENFDTKRRVDLLTPRILTQREIRNLGALKRTGLSIPQEVLLSFSLKEAVYKAIDPFLQRHVTFKEVEVFPENDGTCVAHLCYPEHDFELRLSGQWKLVENYIVTAILSRKVT